MAFQTVSTLNLIQLIALSLHGESRDNVVRHRTRDRRVASSNPGRRGGRIFFSRILFLCWLLFGLRSTPVLPQWHVNGPGLSAKSADVRLHLNMHTPFTQQSWSGLIMLFRHSVGTYHWGKRAHTQLVREHSARVVSARLTIVDWSWPKEWNWWARDDLHYKKKKKRKRRREMNRRSSLQKPGKRGKSPQSSLEKEGEIERSQYIDKTELCKQKQQNGGTRFTFRPFFSTGSCIVATFLSKRYAHRREVKSTPVLNRYRSRTARCNGKKNCGERRFFPALPTSAIMIHNTIQRSYMYFLTSLLAFARRTIMMFHSIVHVHGTNEQYARALRF